MLSAAAALSRYRFGAVAVPAVFMGMVALGLYPMARNADRVIAAKVHSFDSVREAGLWIRDNSTDDDVVISASVPQNTYYAERATFAFPDRESDFQSLLDAKSPKYLAISTWQGLPPWAQDWVRRHRTALSVAHMVMTEEALAKVSAVVYAIRAPAAKP